MRSYPVSKSKILNRIFNPPHINLTEVKKYESIEKSPVDTVCIIEIGKRKISEVSEEFLAEKISFANGYSISRISNPFIWVYSYFNDFSLFELEETEKKNLLSFLRGKKCYSLACDDWNWIEILREIGVV